MRSGRETKRAFFRKDAKATNFTRGVPEKCTVRTCKSRRLRQSCRELASKCSAIGSTVEKDAGRARSETCGAGDAGPVRGARSAVTENEDVHHA